MLTSIIKFGANACGLAAGAARAVSGDGDLRNFLASFIFTQSATSRADAADPNGDINTFRMANLASSQMPAIRPNTPPPQQ